MLRSNTYRIQQVLPNYQLFIKPAVVNGHDRGRPRNGMFIAVPESVKNQVEDISPEFFRVQVLKVTFKSSCCLIVNSYFPCDPRAPGREDPELLETLTSIKSVLARTEFDSVIWCGDINADFVRGSHHTETVQEVVDELNFYTLWEDYEVDFTCVHEVNDVTSVAKLDHFFLSRNLKELVEDAGVIHHPDNKADHCPIYSVFKTLEIKQEVTQSSDANPKPSWRRASLEERKEFQGDLEARLSSVLCPTSVAQCRDTQCQDETHRAELDTFGAELLSTVQEVAEASLPVPRGGQSKGKHNKSLACWDEVVQYKNNSYFWFQVWVSCGRPLNSEVHKVMKRTRNVYHYMIRKCMKAEENMKRSKLLSACLGDGGDLFDEIKKLRSTKRVVATSIDGENSDIAGHFGKIYSELYNSAEDEAEMQDVKLKVDKAVNSASLVDVDKITPEVVKKAAHKLKSGKSDPSYSFSSDCFKNGAENLYVRLSELIQGFVIHSHVTLGLLISTLVPIVKDPLASINISKNYRSVCLSSLTIKLLDWIVIILGGSALGLSELQFAYQVNCSTSQCTWAALETIDYFLKRGAEVYTIATDMSKAFDLALHSKMFLKMFEAKLAPIYVRILIFIYRNQVANVLWNSSERSSNFTIRNGTGQGRVLAAIAYCMYVAGLFILLEKRRSGCWVEGEYRGIWGYSDDNWAMAPSLSSLQDMIVTMEQYALSHNLKFSTDPNPIKCKTKCLAYLKKQRELPSMMLCGTALPWVDRVKHLGITVTNTLNGCQKDIMIKRARFIERSTEILQEFHFAPPAAKMKLHNIYNSHFTGSNCWDMTSRAGEMMEATFNRNIKLTYNLPYPTHRNLLQPISGARPLRLTLAKRLLTFTEKIRKSEKPVLRHIMKLVESDVRTGTGRNLRSILLLTDKSSLNQLHASDVDQVQYYTEPEQWRVLSILEILELRAGEVELPQGWEQDEMEQILEAACCS